MKITPFNFYFVNRIPQFTSPIKSLYLDLHCLISVVLLSTIMNRLLRAYHIRSCMLCVCVCVWVLSIRKVCKVFKSCFNFHLNTKIFGILFCLGKCKWIEVYVPSSLNICPYTLNTHLQSILTEVLMDEMDVLEENVFFILWITHFSTHTVLYSYALKVLTYECVY